jgi:hypothetical protein
MNIKISGETGTYIHEDVNKLVVGVGSKYYWKDDKNIIRVKTSKGLRYRRVNSPLIRRLDYNDTYADISDVVISRSGVEFNKADPEVIEVDGDWTLKEFCREKDGKFSIIDKTNSVKTNGGRWISRADAVKLSESVYGKNEYGMLTGCIKDMEGNWIQKNHSQHIMSLDGIVGVIASHSLAVAGQILKSKQVFEKYSEHNSGNLQRVSMIKMLGTEVQLKRVLKRIEDDYGNDYYIHKNHYDEAARLNKVFVGSVIRDNTNKIRKRLNDNYADSGPDENNAKEINLDYGTMPGGHVYHQSTHRNGASISKAKTGGIGYSFGVEFETSAGQLTNKNCSLIAVDKIGDRSIGALEYVTGVLHGNTGIEQVEKICRTLSQKVLIDDLCSIHVHVGGTKDPRVDNPTFSTKASITMIKLGSKIEDSLYRMNPSSRNRGVKHVAPIDRWAHINFKNYKNLLGSYLFAGDRNGRLADSEVDSDRWNYDQTSRDYGTSSSKWHGGRYKWLNLLNCHTRRGFKTYEIRMWAGSTNFEKIYNYVLLSLAIVWYAENKQNLVMDEDHPITITDVAKAAFAKKPAIRDMVLKYISDRTKRFTTK